MTSRSSCFAAHPEPGPGGTSIRSLARRPVHIGCSGWSYPDWRGRFYPEGLPQSRWLAHYAERFGTVEINNTFYRLPSASAVEQWVEQTPPGFVFTVKASRYLTHVKRLKTNSQYVKRFLDPLAPLIEAGKLGAVLWQLPPTMKRDDERLAHTLELASACRNAVEFRHESWFADDVMSLLSERRAALVIAERHGMDDQPRTLTTGWTLVRLHRGRGRDGNYSKAELDTWRRRIAQWRAEDRGLRLLQQRPERLRAGQRGAAGGLLLRLVPRRAQCLRQLPPNSFDTRPPRFGL